MTVTGNIKQGGSTYLLVALGCACKGSSEGLQLRTHQELACHTL